MGMFDKKKGKQSNHKPESSARNQITTLIAEGSLFEGNLTCSTSTRIDGRLQGKLTGENTVIVGETGFIDGEVHAHEVVVYGKIEGVIESKRMEIKHTGSVEGDTFIDSLVVEEGGVYNGRCSMSHTHESIYIEASGDNVKEIQPAAEVMEADS